MAYTEMTAVSLVLVVRRMMSYLYCNLLRVTFKILYPWALLWPARCRYLWSVYVWAASTAYSLLSHVSTFPLRDTINVDINVPQLIEWRCFCDTWTKWLL